MNNFECQELIYRNDQAGVQVYRGIYSSAHIPVAIKIQQYASLKLANAAIKEAMSTLRVSHSCICHVYDCLLEETADGYQSLILTEWMEGDILKEIKRRKPNGFWTNEEMRWYMYQLIEALASAQAQNVCHRDIKPQNVFYNSQGWMKIGDFGSSLYSIGSTLTHTLQGSPFYLSPELKRCFLESGGSIGNVVHDPFRSDVYSLGLTFLQMARLEEPKELMDLPTLAQNTEYVLGMLTYDEDVKYILRMMLGVDNRPDFTELNTWIKTYYANIQVPESSYQAQSLGNQGSQYYDPQPDVAQNDGQVSTFQDMAQQPEAEFSTIPPMEHPPENLPGANLQQPDEERKLTVCVMCGERNSSKKWRKYPDEKHVLYQQHFKQVCTLDCLDSLIATLQVPQPVDLSIMLSTQQPEENKAPAEVKENTCTLCQRHINWETDSSFSLNCGHAICTTGCFVETVATARKNAKTQIKCSFCNEYISKKIFAAARVSFRRQEHAPSAKCLYCGNITDRIAKCHHPFCRECGKILKFDLLDHCILCTFKAKPPNNT